MKIAFVDTKKTGHHLEYIYSICSKLSERSIDSEVDVFCNEIIYDYVKKNDLQEFQENRNFKIKTGQLEEVKGNWLQISKTAYHNIDRLKNYDRIIFLSINQYLPALFLYAILKSPSFSFSGILFNPHVKGKNDRKKWFRDFVFKNVIKKYSECRIFVLNDEESANILNDKYSTQAFDVLSDPIPEFYYEDLENENKNSDTTTFTMIGSITKRKGVFEFLQAIKESNSTNRFLIAGSIKEGILNEVQQRVKELKVKGFNITLRNEFLSNKEFARTIVESEVLVIPYLTKGASSGILGHAAYNRKPVIGPEKGLLSNIINDYGLGVTVDPTNSSSFSKYLREMNVIISAQNTKNRQQYIAHNSVDSFYRKLKEENF